MFRVFGIARTEEVSSPLVVRQAPPVSSAEMDAARRPAARAIFVFGTDLDMAASVGIEEARDGVASLVDERWRVALAGARHHLVRGTGHGAAVSADVVVQRPVGELAERERGGHLSGLLPPRGQGLCS